MSGGPVIGRRVHHFSSHHQLMSSEYGQWNGTWWAVTPDGHTANLSGRDVTEHADGTISVAGSIEVKGSRQGESQVVFHGYLEHGVWREA